MNVFLVIILCLFVIGVMLGYLAGYIKGATVTTEQLTGEKPTHIQVIFG